ncbi:MAG: 30S ribosomal protein S8 [bacterium]|nr:30S ribosomal protein S8 [bacterium]
MVTDKISDLIIRIKNASEAGKDIVSTSHSKYAESIARALLSAGYVKSVEAKGKGVAKTLEIGVLYNDSTPKVARIHGVERISRISKRIYHQSRDIRSYKNGFGSVIYSTPKGILTDSEAKKQNVGGEILFRIW